MKQNKLYVLLGKSGSGKSVTERYLADKCNVTRVVSTTTRPIRTSDGERHGVDYYYISVEDYMNKLLKQELIAPMTYHTKFGDWHYGIDKNTIDLSKGDYICVIEPNGFMDLQLKFGRENIVVILLTVDDETRIERSKKRSNGTEQELAEIERRVEADKKDFATVESLVDHIIENVNMEDTFAQALAIMEGR